MGPHLLAWELQLELGNNQVWTPALPDFVQWDKQCLWGRHTLMRRIKWVHIFDVNQVFPRTPLQCLSISRTPNQIISITEWANSYIVDSYKAATSLVTNGPTRLFHKNCTVQSDYLSIAARWWGPRGDHYRQSGRKTPLQTPHPLRSSPLLHELSIQAINLHPTQGSHAL